MFGLLFSELLTVELGISTRQSCLTICFITRVSDSESPKGSVKNYLLIAWARKQPKTWD